MSLLDARSASDTCDHTWREDYVCDHCGAVKRPAPRWVAYAIAELGHAKLEACRVLIESWDQLTGMGVPIKFVRELLTEDLPDAEPMIHMRRWEGSTTPIVLVGDVGTAKSYALAWWAYKRQREGLLTHWESVSRWSAMSFPELREMNQSLVSKPAVVLDDIGAGGIGRPAVENLEGLILARHEAELPTAVAMNADKTQTRAILGRRVLDRVVREGGTIEALESTKSLRRPRPEGPAPARSRARWLLEVVGCEMVSRGEERTETIPTYDCEGVQTGERQVVVQLTGEYSSSPTFGDILAARPDYRDAERACEHLGLDTDAVLARAFELEADSTDDPMQRAADAYMAGLRAKIERQETAKRQTNDEIHQEARDLVATRRARVNAELVRRGKEPLHSLDHWLTPESGGDVSARK